MMQQYGQIINTIHSKKFLAALALFIGILLFIMSLSLNFSFITIIALICSVACIFFGISSIFFSIELYEEAVVIKTLFKSNKIERKQIEMIDYGKYDPTVYDFQRSDKPQLKIITYDGITYKFPYTAYKDLYNKIKSYQLKYMIPDNNRSSSV